MNRAGTVIVGAGQAGLALSWALTRAGHDHVLLERGRVGERWRSERWDSLALLSPTWANRLPGAPDVGDPDGFLGRDAFADSLDDYAAGFGAPVREQTPVTAVERCAGGFVVRDGCGGVWETPDVVVASGWCDLPLVPSVARSGPDEVMQLHASRYRAPDQLPEGGVLVVGAGASGQQLAYELAQDGRRVVMATGRHARAVRRYRGRDIWQWMDDLGILGQTIEDVHRGPGRPAEPSLPLDGRAGGRRLDLNVLAGLGVTLAGRVTGFAGHEVCFDDGLRERVEVAEQRFRALLGRIDEHIVRHGLERRLPAPEAIPAVDVGTPPRRIDLAAQGIRTVLWATGYRRELPWLRFPVRTAGGDIAHRHGRTAVPGLHTLGMAWQRRRTSHQIGGVGLDALEIAGRIMARAEGTSTERELVAA